MTKNNYTKTLSKLQNTLRIDKLSQKNKQKLSLLFTLITITTIAFTLAFTFNVNFKNLINGTSTAKKDTNIQISDADKVILSKLDKLSLINPDELLYKTIGLDDFPIYPKSWIERYFTLTERANSLISGPAGDPDGDGLSNKEEYLYGSDPRNRDTLCNNKIEGDSCLGKSDSENVKNGISPLTGLSLGNNPSTYRVKRDELNILKEVEDSFEQQAKEGIDFPTLFQLSKKIDLSREYNEISVNEVDDSRNYVIEYSKKRIDIIENYINDDELTNFTKIYQITKFQELDKIKNKYSGELTNLENVQTPKKYVGGHKAYIMIFKKLIALMDYRSLGLKNNTILTNEFKTESKNKSIEIVWSYRKLNDELSKVPSIE